MSNVCRPVSRLKHNQRKRSSAPRPSQNSPQELLSCAKRRKSHSEFLSSHIHQGQDTPATSSNHDLEEANQEDYDDLISDKSLLGMSIVTTSTQHPCQQGGAAALNAINVSPILPNPSQMNRQRLQGILHKQPLFIASSPKFPHGGAGKPSGQELSSARCAEDPHQISGDDDLFAEEDILPETSEGKDAQAQEILAVRQHQPCGISHASNEDPVQEGESNLGQNHDRSPVPTNQRSTCDPWDSDDSFYAQLNLSLLVRQSQNRDETGAANANAIKPSSSHGGHEDSSKTASPEGVGTSESRESLLKEGRCTETEEMQGGQCAYGNGLNAMQGVGHSRNIPKSSVPVSPLCLSAQVESVLPFPDDIGCDVAGRNASKMGQGNRAEQTPDNETWFSQLRSNSKQNSAPSSPRKGESGERSPQNLLNAKQSLELKAGDTSKGDGQTCFGAGASVRTPNSNSMATSRLKQRLQSNAKSVTTPTSTRAQQLQKRVVDEALDKMATVGSEAMERDIGPFYGLPRKVQDLLEKQRGIKRLYDWQHECLSHPALRKGCNLVYSLPTSGGKTLVAEILIMQQILCHEKDALLILPFVSIVQEKVTSMSPMAVELGFLVEEYASSKGAIPPRRRRKKNALYVCTLEKAHTLVNSLIQEERIKEIGLTVVDELHMVGNGGRRGASLEICLAKLLHMNSCQIVGMSATLSNIQDLCRFLRAEVYTNNFRPVELKEYIKLEDNIFYVNPGCNLPEDEKFTHARTVAFQYSRVMQQNDPDHLVGLALEVVPASSCLIFCATKKNCQNVAEIICKFAPRNLAKHLFQHKHEEKQELLSSLLREGDNHICPTLKRTIPYGAAYHHGGLTMDERKLIEDAYSDGTLCLLTATSTLAAGVNLPARRVILRSPYIARDLMTASQYKQMVGRAGRAGKDSSGESILIIKPKERQLVNELLNTPLEGCYSSLMHEEGKGMRSLVLSLISLKITTTHYSLQTFIENTLCGIQAGEFQRDLVELSNNALLQVIDLQLVKEARNSTLLEVTNVGHACFRGSIDIDLCQTLYEDLKTACDHRLILANSLHLLYLVTPYDQIDSARPNWNIYMRYFSCLSEAERKVAELIGVTEFYMQSKMTGHTSKKFTPELERRAQRFYLTLMLWQMLSRRSVWEVAARFEVPRGFVQSLFSSAASFAFSVQRFCEDLPEFWAVHQLLSKLVLDLTYCSTADLLPLLEIPGVKQGRARQLVKAGYKTMQHLAHAEPKDLIASIENLPKKIAQQIVAAAKMALAEKIEALNEEAEELNTKPKKMSPT